MRAYVSINENINENRNVNRLDLFDALEKQKETIESNFGSPLEWNRKSSSAWVGISRDGNIDLTDDTLAEVREWHIENLPKLKEAFQPEIEQALKTLE